MTKSSLSPCAMTCLPPSCLSMLGTDQGPRKDVKVQVQVQVLVLRLTCTNWVPWNVIHLSQLNNAKRQNSFENPTFSRKAVGKDSK